MTDPTLVFKANTDQLKDAEKTLKDVETQGKKTDKVVDQFETSINKTTQAFKLQKGAAGQAAFQIQDFAVQTAGGTSAMIAFTQQAPQLLGIFGSGGAILGAIVAVSAAIAGPFVTSLLDAESAADRLAGAIDDLDLIIESAEDDTLKFTDRLRDLAQFGDAVAQSALREALRDVQDGIKAVNDEATDLAESLSPNELGGRFSRFSLLLDGLRDQFVAGDITLQQFVEQFVELERKSPEVSKEVRGVVSAFQELLIQRDKLSERQSLLTGETSEGLSSEEKRLQEHLVRQEEIRQRALDRQLLAEQRAQERLAQQEQDALDRELENLESYLLTRQEREEGLYLYRKNLIKLNVEDEERQNELLAALDDKRAKQRLASAATYYGQLKGLMSSENSKLFRVGQASAIAEATINGYQAASNAYANAPNPIVGAAMAALSAIQTGALISEIASAKPPARAQGGQVRAGQSYVVGENGREVLTMGNMGGSITPNHKLAANDGAPMQVVTNVKIIGGNPEATANTSITKTDRQYIIDVVVDQMSNPSSKGRSGMARTSNLQNRGVR